MDEQNIYLIIYYLAGKPEEYTSYVRGENQKQAITRWFNHLIENNDYYVILSMLANYYKLADDDIIDAKGFTYQDRQWVLSNAINQNLDRYVFKNTEDDRHKDSEIEKIVLYHTGDTKAYIGQRDKLTSHVDRVRILKLSDIVI